MKSFKVFFLLVWGTASFALGDGFLPPYPDNPQECEIHFLKLSEHYVIPEGTPLAKEEERELRLRLGKISYLMDRHTETISLRNIASAYLSTIRKRPLSYVFRDATFLVEGEDHIFTTGDVEEYVAWFSGPDKPLSGDLLKSWYEFLELNRIFSETRLRYFDTLIGPAGVPIDKVLDEADALLSKTALKRARLNVIATLKRSTVKEAIKGQKPSRSASGSRFKNNATNSRLKNNVRLLLVNREKWGEDGVNHLSDQLAFYSYLQERSLPREFFRRIFNLSVERLAELAY